MNVDWDVVVTALTSAGLGSLVATAIARQGERRARRAEVLDAIAATAGLLGPSLARGATETMVAGEPLNEHLTRARTSALVVGLPRLVVDEYEAVARAEAYSINNDLRDGRIEAHLAAMEKTLVAYAWHPWLARLWVHPSFKQELRRMRALELKSDRVREVMWQGKPSFAAQATPQVEGDPEG